MANKGILAVPAIVLVLTGILIYAVISGPRLQIAGHGSREHVTVAEQAENFRDTLVTMSDEGENYTISAQYPMTGTPFFDNACATFVQEQVDTFRTAVAGLRPLDTLKFPLAIVYRTSVFQDTIIGVKFDVYSFLGGAHGQTRIFTFTCDSTNARMLKLDDLFDPSTHYLDTFATLCRPELAAMIGERADPAWIEKGTAPTPENYSRTLLSNDGLTIVFEAYAVAPGAYGEQEVTLPWSKIADLLRPELRDHVKAHRQ